MPSVVSCPVFSSLAVRCHHERSLYKQEQQGELLEPSIPCWSFQVLWRQQGVGMRSAGSDAQERAHGARSLPCTQAVQGLPQGYGGISHPPDHIARLRDPKPQASCVYMFI